MLNVRMGFVEMPSFWKKNNSIIISNNKFIICDDCLCDNEYFIVGYCKSYDENKSEPLPENYHIGDHREGLYDFI